MRRILALIYAHVLREGVMSTLFMFIVFCTALGVIWGWGVGFTVFLAGVMLVLLETD